MRIYVENWTIKIGLCLLSFAACHAPLDHHLPELQRTYDSLEKLYGNGPWPDPFETNYAGLQKKAQTNPGKHADWLTTADNIYTTVKEFTARMEDGRKRLKNADANGKDTRLAEKMLAHTRWGDSLRNELFRTLSVCRRCSQNPESPEAFAIVNGDLWLCTDRRYWNDEAFAGLSTSEASMKLSDFGVICQVQAQMIFENMIKQF